MYIYILKIWVSRDNNRNLEWTSLRGADKKKLLWNLSSVTTQIIPGSNGFKIQELWKVILTSNDNILIYDKIYCLGFQGPLLFNYKKISNKGRS